MKKAIKSGDNVKVGNTGKKGEVMEVNGAVTQVLYNDGKISIVPTRWIRE